MTVENSFVLFLTEWRTLMFANKTADEGNRTRDGRIWEIQTSEDLANTASGCDELKHLLEAHRDQNCTVNPYIENILKFYEFFYQVSWEQENSWQRRESWLQTEEKPQFTRGPSRLGPPLTTNFVFQTILAWSHWLRFCHFQRWIISHSPKLWPPLLKKKIFWLHKKLQRWSNLSVKEMH